MRRSFLTSYVFGAEAIIQHWLWKTLKTATKSFGPLLIVFGDDYDATAACVPLPGNGYLPLFHVQALLLLISLS